MVRAPLSLSLYAQFISFPALYASYRANSVFLVACHMQSAPYLGSAALCVPVCPVDDIHRTNIPRFIYPTLNHDGLSQGCDDAGVVDGVGTSDVPW